MQFLIIFVSCHRKNVSFWFRGCNAAPIRPLCFECAVAPPFCLGDTQSVVDLAQISSFLEYLPWVSRAWSWAISSSCLEHPRQVHWHLPPEQNLSISLSRLYSPWWTLPDFILCPWHLTQRLSHSYWKSPNVYRNKYMLRLCVLESCTKEGTLPSFWDNLQVKDHKCLIIHMANVVLMHMLLFADHLF